MKTRTFNKWNKKGRWIHAGEKAVGFTKKGKPLFTEDQTYGAPERDGFEEFDNTNKGREYTDGFGIDHSDVAGLPDGYSN